MENKSPLFHFRYDENNRPVATAESPQAYELFAIFLTYDCTTNDQIRMTLESVYELQHGRVSKNHTRAPHTDLMITKERVSVSIKADRLTDSPYHGQVHRLSLDDFRGIVMAWRLFLIADG